MIDRNLYNLYMGYLKYNWDMTVHSAGDGVVIVRTAYVPAGHGHCVFFSLFKSPGDLDVFCMGFQNV